MATLTIEIPDDLMDQIALVRNQLPDLLCRYLHPLANFRPTSHMQDRMGYLLAQSQADALPPVEAQELDEYGRIEYLIVLLKTGNLIQRSQLSA